MELALNAATVRKQWDLAQIIEGCARHGIRGISPWRDQIQKTGLRRTISLVKQRTSLLPPHMPG